MIGHIQMSQKEFKHYRLAIDVLEGKLSILDFSVLIGKSYRQAQRIIKNVCSKDIGVRSKKLNPASIDLIKTHNRAAMIKILR
jgi:hypothetical protein